MGHIQNGYNVIANYVRNSSTYMHMKFMQNLTFVEEKHPLIIAKRASIYA